MVSKKLSGKVLQENWTGAGVEQSRWSLDFSRVDRKNAVLGWYSLLTLYLSS